MEVIVENPEQDEDDGSQHAADDTADVDAAATVVTIDSFSVVSARSASPSCLAAEDRENETHTGQRATPVVAWVCTTRKSEKADLPVLSITTKVCEEEASAMRARCFGGSN